MKIKKVVALAATCAIGISTLVGCSSVENKGSNGGSSSSGSVTLDVNGKDITYDKVPERVVALNFENLQTLVALGLEDKIVGYTSAHFKLEEMLPEYQSKMKDLNCIGLSAAYEPVLNLNPDFIYAYEWSFNNESLTEPDDLLNEGIKYYMEYGNRKSNTDHKYEYVYQDLRDLGKIFHVEDRAEEIISGLEKRVADVESKAVKNSPRVFIYDSGDKQAYTAGKRALQSKMLETCGAVNVFEDLDADYEEVSWEEVAKRNPEWILINEYEDENLTESKTEFLKNNDALKDCDAIKNNKIISINLIELREGLQFVDGLDKTLDALSKGE